MSNAKISALKNKFNALSADQKKELLVKLNANALDGVDDAIGSPNLSKAQARLWLLEQLNHCPYMYHIPCIVPLPEAVDLDALQKAFQIVMQENPVLSSYFKTEGEEVRHYNDTLCDLNLSIIELQDTLDSFIQIEPHTPLAPFFLEAFSLDKAPLMRVAVLKTPTQRVLLLCCHHLIVDGWSISLLIEALNRHYQVDLQVPCTIDNGYKDFIAWEQLHNKTSLLNKEKDYWMNRLTASQFTVDLTTDYPRPFSVSGPGQTQHVIIPQALSDTLARFAKSNGFTLNQLYLFAFQFLLSRYSGQDDLVIGIPVAGRPEPRWHNTIGMFVNTLLHQTVIDYDACLLDQLLQVQKQLLHDLSHANLPFDELIKMLYAQKKIEPNQGINILYNFIQSQPLVLFGEPSTPVYCALPISKFDLSLHVYAKETSTDLFFEYRTCLYKKESIEEYVNYYLKLLETMPLCADKSLIEWVWMVS